VIGLNVTHPNPDPTAFFHDGVRAHRQLGGDSILARNGDAQTFAVVGEAVVSADEYVIDHGAEGQRVSAVRALISERNDAATSIAIQRHRLTENCSRNRSFGELRRERCDVPVLMKKHVPPGFAPRQGAQWFRADATADFAKANAGVIRRQHLAT
jgi:hypothetical protein